MSGAVAVFLSYLIWGLSPLYWKQLSHLPGGYVVLHRIVWSFVILICWFGLRECVHQCKSAASSKDFPLRIFAALCLGTNWLVFILAIEYNRAAEASLGYFVLPLLIILFGSLILREGISLTGKYAIGVVGLGIAVQLCAAEQFPSFALGLVASYLCYTILYKVRQWPVIQGALLEMALLSSVALFVLCWNYLNLLQNHSFHEIYLLLGAGPLTVIPLLLCNYGVKKIDLVLVGPLQYLNPSLQFFIAAFIFGEAISSVELTSFVCVWLGCAIFLYDRMRSRISKIPVHKMKLPS